MRKSDLMIQMLEQQQNQARVPAEAKFFQACPGGYGEGDEFWGISVPQQRQVSRVWNKELGPEELAELLSHPVHEVRLTALMAMVLKFQRSKSKDERKRLVDLYLANTAGVNNWDLVDSSAHHILGEWLTDKDWSVLISLAESDNLWEQRIAMIATHAFIRKRIWQPTLMLAEMLLHHKHDLIHKAVGWMLRELGNLDLETETGFLKKHYKNMPRTMLRYAIEKFPEDLRQDFLKGRV